MVCPPLVYGLGINEEIAYLCAYALYDIDQDERAVTKAGCSGHLARKIDVTRSIDHIYDVG